MSITIETYRKIFNDSEGVYIEVGPDPDGSGLINLIVRGKENELYFGKADIIIGSEMALSLSKALALSAKEAIENEKEITGN